MRLLRTILVVLLAALPLRADEVIDPADTDALHKAPNLKPGLPCKQGIIIERGGYALGYSEKHEQARWVQYHISKSEVLNDRVDRTDNYRPDSAIKTDSASLGDYKHSGYDRGHLAPAAAMNYSADAMSDSFYLSNMSPQKAGFNRGIWRKTESLIRTWAVENKALYVVTGPVFQGNMERIGSNDVTVPAGYFKAVLDASEPQIKAIGLVFPHKRSSKPLRSFAVSIDKVEQITGLDFFSKIPDQKEKRLESNRNPGQWSWETQSYQHGGSDEGSTGGTQATAKNFDQSKYPYAASENSNKFHESDCHYVEDIHADNLILYETRQEARQDGKVPCKVCDP